MERETLEMDVVFVGAGPANLSGALHLSRLIKQHNIWIESWSPLGSGRMLNDATVGAIGCEGRRIDSACMPFQLVD